MKDDELGDWRIGAVSTLAEDLPPAYPGGPSHKKGTGIYHTTASSDTEHGNLAFITPHPCALSFNIALQQAKEAKRLKDDLDTVVAPSPDGGVNLIPMKHTPFLYDYLEKAMIVATFSFQAIEAFANNELITNAKEEIRIKRRKKWQSFSPIEAERHLSTEEKIATILPELLNTPTPKGNPPWPGFKALKKARDSTIHIKNKDSFQTSRSESLFLDLVTNNPESYPKNALKLVNWFFKDRTKPRWLIFMERDLAQI